jgi:hypothetical protein
MPPALADHSIALLETMHNMTDTRASYFNYMDRDQPDHLRLYFGEANLARLVGIKAAWDPTNLFRTPSSFQTTSTTSTSTRTTASTSSIAKRGGPNGGGGGGKGNPDHANNYPSPSTNGHVGMWTGLSVLALVLGVVFIAVCTVLGFWTEMGTQQNCFGSHTCCKLETCIHVCSIIMLLWCSISSCSHHNLYKSH